jgi:hypothetical protein
MLLMRAFQERSNEFLRAGAEAMQKGDKAMREAAVASRG